MADVVQALRELGYRGWKVLGDPKTKGEFESSFSVLLEDGTESKDSKDWPKDLTWEAVETKMDELTAAEPMIELRKQRNQKLAETDYMGNSDVTMSDAWKTYRQALRDITTHSNWPNLKRPGPDGSGDNDWPVKPS